MRDLINKLSLLESSNSNIRKIATFFIPWQDVIELPIVIQFPFPLLGKTHKMLFTLSYGINKNTGSLEKLPWPHRLVYVDTDVEDIMTGASDSAWTKISNEFTDIVVNDLSLDNSKIKAETKNVLLNMGFSDGAANEFIDNISVSSDGDITVRLPSANEMRRFQTNSKFYNEVNAAYEWRQESEV